ncbi:MAG: hypothetical protein N3G21_11440 [Candidatus Hydrogenedentes bacterium]|nr:hypothetical protein [Candidatus Hydrogenedentota bacterium]
MQIINSRLIYSQKDEFHIAPVYSSKEYFLPILVGVLVIIIGSFPYIYGYYIAGNEKVFMGMVGRGTHASFGYIMFQRQALEGKTFLRNQCTPEPLGSRYFNPEWWIMGRLASWCNISLIQLHHIDRILSVLLFVITVYYLLSVTLETFSQRAFVFLLIVFGSGFGWVIWTFNYFFKTGYPISWDIQGVQVFGYLINKPHFIRAFVFATLMYAWLIRGFQSSYLIYFLLSGFAGFVHIIIRPYYIPETFILYLILPPIHFWVTKKTDKRILLYSIIAIALHIPAFAYYAWFAIDDPLGMRGWSVKDHFLGKPGMLIEYVMGIGWTFLLCIFFIHYIVRQCKKRLTILMIFVWALVSWGVCNLYPYWKLGHEGGLNVFWVAMPILTIFGPWTWLKEFISKTEKLQILFSNKVLFVGGLLLILLSTPSSIYVYANMFTSLRNGHPLWTYYATKDLYDSFQWLNENTEEDSVVLATQRTSQLVFAWTHCKTVTGSFILTINFGQKDAEVNRFYTESDCESFSKNLLEKYRVKYVYYGPYEKELSKEIPPKILTELKPIFKKGDTEIYKVE